MKSITTSLSANDPAYAARQARSLPVLSSMSSVRGYPSKLKIYRIRGSRFWQARCFMEGKMYVRSTREIEKTQAIEAAKHFYESLLIRFRQSGQGDLANLDLLQKKESDSHYRFQNLAAKALELERGRMLRGELSLQFFKALRNRMTKMITPYFMDKDVRSLNQGNLSEFVNVLQKKELSSVTIIQYLQSIRLVFKYAQAADLISAIPSFPKIRLKFQPRGSFTLPEYLLLLRTAKRMSRLSEPEKPACHRYRAGGIFTRTESVPREIPWVIGFMVNSFIRPTDLKYIQHKHVDIIQGEHLYLRLSLPETKRHSTPIVTLRPAVRIYRHLLAHAVSIGKARADDYLFMPHVDDRDAAVVVLSQHFNKILVATGLKHGDLGQERSLYSLRHTAIMFRLLYGKGIDLLTLARNARTSVQMIEEFYASHLTAEMNIGLLQSKRSRSAMGPTK
jgi:hypothetical protein